jgi:hypothetical protein
MHDFKNSRYGSQLDSRIIITTYTGGIKKIEKLYDDMFYTNGFVEVLDANHLTTTATISFDYIY